MAPELQVSSKATVFVVPKKEERALRDSTKDDCKGA